MGNFISQRLDRIFPQCNLLHETILYQREMFSFGKSELFYTFSESVENFPR